MISHGGIIWGEGIQEERIVLNLGQDRIQEKEKRKLVNHQNNKNRWSKDHRQKPQIRDHPTLIIII
jgi:hypothetical protein